MEGLEAFYSTIAGSISCPQDAVVCFVHWGVIRNGWKCLGAGDEPGADDKRSELLPAGWNGNNGELYTLRYQDRDGTANYLLKAQTVEDAVVINLINSDTLRDSDLTVRTSDHTDSEQLRSFERVYRDADGLAEKVRTQLLSPQDPPKEEAPPPPPQKRNAATTTTAAHGGDAGRGYDERRGGDRDEDYAYPGGEYMPQRPPLGSPWRPAYVPQAPVPPGQWPSGLWPDVGGGDLDPLNPLGSGMHMDPRNAMPPRFSPYGGGGAGPSSSILPPGSVPPGARYDPFGPMEPEPDHLPPPGYDPNPRPLHGPRFGPPGGGHGHRPRPGPPGPEFS